MGCRLISQRVTAEVEKILTKSAPQKYLKTIPDLP